MGTTQKSRIHVGCSGYDYPAWRGGFYPEDAKRDRLLQHYAERFDCVEINNTFYSLPRPATLKSWRTRVPKDFLFVLKLSRYGTHMKHLKDPGDWIGNFTDRVRDLDGNLGPILVQLPPGWRADAARLRDFLQAARRAGKRTQRWAVEIRDESWLTQDVYDTLADASAALVIHDLIEDHPRELTADWVYARYHGPDPSRPYHGAYPHQRLAADARRMAAWIRGGRDVFAFFNNDADGYAPRDAERLRGYIEEALA